MTTIPTTVAGAGSGEPVAEIEPVAAGVRCAGCGYELVGLDPDSLCPECGRAVDDSLRGLYLVYRPMGYVKSLHRGLGMVRLGILLNVVFTIVWFIAAAALGAAASGPISVVGAIALVISLAIQVMALVGWIWFTARDPSDPLEDRSANSRRLVRIGAIGLLVMVGVQLVFSLLVPSQTMAPATGGAVPAMVALLALFVGLANVVLVGLLFFASMVYIRRLGARIPDPKVHRLAKSRMISVPIITVAVPILAVIAGVAIAVLAGSAAFALYIALYFVALLGPLIALVLYYNFLSLTRKSLGRVLEAQRGYDPTR